MTQTLWSKVFLLDCSNVRPDLTTPFRGTFLTELKKGSPREDPSECLVTHRHQMDGVYIDSLGDSFLLISSKRQLQTVVPSSFLYPDPYDTRCFSERHHRFLGTSTKLSNQWRLNSNVSYITKLSVECLAGELRTS